MLLDAFRAPDTSFVFLLSSSSSVVLLAFVVIGQSSLVFRHSTENPPKQSALFAVLLNAQMLLGCK